MSIVLKCPKCGKRYELEGSVAGKKLRCAGCDLVFRVPVGSSEPRSAAGPAGQGPTRARIASPAPGGTGRARAQPRPRAVENEDPGEDGDHSWPEDGGSESMPAPIRRTQATAAGSGPPLGLLLGVGAGGLVIILGVIAGVLVMNSGRGHRAEPNQGGAGAGDASPSLAERVLSAVTGSEPFTDVGNYPEIGPLLPPLLAPPPLRDLSVHERQARAMIGAIGRMNDILATVHDVASMQAAGLQLKNLSEQMRNELKQNAPTFRPTAAEDAELARRVAGDARRETARLRQESVRISTVPGLGIAGTQLLALGTQMSIPLEQSLMLAQSFKPQSGPAPYAEVYVQLQNADDAVVCHQKLHALLEGATGIQAMYESAKKRASYRVWPVDDVGEYSRKITFGKATVKGRNIFVMADRFSAEDVAAAKEVEKKAEDALRAKIMAGSSKNENPSDPKPPAGADNVTKALFGLRSKNPGRRKQAIDELYNLRAKDERRDEVQKELMPLLDDPDDFFVIDVMRRWPNGGTTTPCRR